MTQFEKDMALEQLKDILFKCSSCRKCSMSSCYKCENDNTRQLIFDEFGWING